ncbi:hypothetical protein HK101_008608 [Irineochytrium annulatum]|nr:hypothetical protein HK101_008608 [Irineochytrium annulatum]
MEVWKRVREEQAAAAAQEEGEAFDDDGVEEEEEDNDVGLPEERDAAVAAHAAEVAKVHARSVQTPAAMEAARIAEEKAVHTSAIAAVATARRGGSAASSVKSNDHSSSEEESSDDEFERRGRTRYRNNPPYKPSLNTLGEELRHSPDAHSGSTAVNTPPPPQEPASTPTAFVSVPFRAAAQKNAAPTLEVRETQQQQQQTLGRIMGNMMGGNASRDDVGVGGLVGDTSESGRGGVSMGKSWSIFSHGNRRKKGGDEGGGGEAMSAAEPSEPSSSKGGGRRTKVTGARFYDKAQVVHRWFV